MIHGTWPGDAARDEAPAAPVLVPCYVGLRCLAARREDMQPAICLSCARMIAEQREREARR